MRADTRAVLRQMRECVWDGTAAAGGAGGRALGGSMEASRRPPPRRSRLVARSRGEGTHAPGAGSSAATPGAHGCRSTPPPIRIASFSALSCTAGHSQDIPA